jgi:hypothetical protein
MELKDMPDFNVIVDSMQTSGNCLRCGFRFYLPPWIALSMPMLPSRLSQRYFAAQYLDALVVAHLAVDERVHLLSGQMQLIRHQVQDAIAAFTCAVAVVRHNPCRLFIYIKPKCLVVPPSPYLDETLFEERPPDVIDTARPHVI